MHAYIHKIKNIYIDEHAWKDRHNVKRKEKKKGESIHTHNMTYTSVPYVMQTAQHQKRICTFVSENDCYSSNSNRKWYVAYFLVSDHPIHNTWVWWQANSLAICTPLSTWKLHSQGQTAFLLNEKCAQARSRKKRSKRTICLQSARRAHTYLKPTIWTLPLYLCHQESLLPFPKNICMPSQVIILDNLYKLN